MESLHVSGYTSAEGIYKYDYEMDDIQRSENLLEGKSVS